MWLLRVRVTCTSFAVEHAASTDIAKSNPGVPACDRRSYLVPEEGKGVKDKQPRRSELPCGKE